VQTGFGAVVGLLGGKRLHGSDAKVLGLFLPDVGTCFIGARFIGTRFIGTRLEERRRSKDIAVKLSPWRR
jgi:hypothetical protein